MSAPVCVWTVHVCVWTVHVCVWTVHVCVWTVHVCVWTVHVCVWTVHVCVWTVHVCVWIACVHVTYYVYACACWCLFALLCAYSCVYEHARVCSVCAFLHCENLCMRARVIVRVREMHIYGIVFYRLRTLSTALFHRHELEIFYLSSEARKIIIRELK